MLPADDAPAQEASGYGFRYSALTKLMREVIACLLYTSAPGENIRARVTGPYTGGDVVLNEDCLLYTSHEPNARENFLRLFGTAPLGNDFRLREIRDRPAATGDQK